MGNGHHSKVIVVGCDVGGYGVIRALAMKQIPVIALNYDSYVSGNASAFASKYPVEKVQAPHPRKEVEAFIELLLRNVDRWGGSLILDTDDNAAVTISKYKVLLAEHYKIVTADWNILRKFIEKEKTFHICSSCDVPHPKTLLPKSLEEVEGQLDEILYPCILKPVRGHEFMGTFKKKNFEVSNDTELLEKFRLCLDAGHEVMIQEIIPGPDTNIHKCMAYIDSRGELTAKFFYHKIRQNPPQFGVMRVGISRGRDPMVEELSERLLRTAEYKGVCTVEFRKDPRDQKLKLIEVNARMPRMNWLASYSGVNFPWIIYMDLVENKQATVDEYKESVYWIEFYADLKNTLFNRSKEAFTWRDYLRPYFAKDKTFALLSRNDLRPFTTQITTLPMRYIRSLKRKRKSPLRSIGPKTRTPAVVTINHEQGDQ